MKIGKRKTPDNDLGVFVIVVRFRNNIHDSYLLDLVGSQALFCSDCKYALKFMSRTYAEEQAKRIRGAKVIQI